MDTVKGAIWQHLFVSQTEAHTWNLITRRDWLMMARIIQQRSLGCVQAVTGGRITLKTQMSLIVRSRENWLVWNHDGALGANLNFQQSDLDNFSDCHTAKLHRGGNHSWKVLYS